MQPIRHGLPHLQSGPPGHKFGIKYAISKHSTHFCWTLDPVFNMPECSVCTYHVTHRLCLNNVLDKCMSLWGWVWASGTCRTWGSCMHEMQKYTDMHNTGAVSQASWSSLAGTLHTAYMHAAQWSITPCTLQDMWIWHERWNQFHCLLWCTNMEFSRYSDNQ